jgi:ankyrin repeat protein
MKMTDPRRAFDLLQAGDADALQRLLEEDPAVSEATDASGVSLLMHSIYRSRRDLAEAIASRKKSLDIFEAAALGRLDRLTACLGETRGRGDSINSYSKDGFTALHLACFFSQPEAARLLIDSGAVVDIVAANPTRVMPLHSAASSRNLEAARLLLEHGAPVNARQQGGWVSIHAAAQNGDRPMVELLLQHAANPSLANDGGKTPAIVAREAGHGEIAALLEKTRKLLI